MIACGQQEVSIPGKPDLSITSDDVLAIIAETYVYGYPLLMIDLTKKVGTNTVQPDPVRPIAPINQLSHFRAFPDPTSKAVVRPNVDTYYSISWLDLAKEPIILKMPATDRYYLMQFLDGYTNVFASIGTRTTGVEAGEFAIVGPNWKGKLPDNLKVYKSPTNMVWMLGRIQTNDELDGQTVVRAIQDSMAVYPLSSMNEDSFVQPDGTHDESLVGTTPKEMIEDLSIEEALNRITTLMVDNPPSIRDSVLINKMESIGLVPGQEPRLEFDNFILQQKIKAIPSTVAKRFRALSATPNKDLQVNNWNFVKSGIGTYGTEYKRRAYIAFIGLGANLPEDAIYPRTAIDVNGAPLAGSQKYVIHMDAEQLPPVKAFWSLTAYNEEGFLIENALNRYALGSQKELVYNEDGSLDIYIQSSKPSAEQLQNWLPIAPEAPFNLMFRLYWPEERALNGEWTPPSVIPVEED